MPMLCFQRLYGSSTFEMHAEELDLILISVHWSSCVNVYPETSFKSLSSSTTVLHYSLRQYRGGRTALMTSQNQGKLLAATEIKGDKQDNKLSAAINQRSN